MDECLLDFEKIVSAFEIVATRRDKSGDADRTAAAQAYLETILSGKTVGYKKHLVRRFEDIVNAIFKTTTQLELCRRLKEMESDGEDLAAVVGGGAPIVLDGERIKEAWAVIMEALLELSARALGEFEEDENI